MSAKPYQPELGQAMFGQPHQAFEVPEIMEAALASISSELDRVMWNIHQEPYDNPFSNSGNRFDCDEFKVHAYSWGDDDQAFNFAWKDLRISWYKYLGRGMSANQEITPQMASDCLVACLNAVRNYEKSRP